MLLHTPAWTRGLSSPDICTETQIQPNHRLHCPGKPFWMSPSQRDAGAAALSAVRDGFKSCTYASKRSASAALTPAPAKWARRFWLEICSTYRQGESSAGLCFQNRISASCGIASPLSAAHRERNLVHALHAGRGEDGLSSAELPTEQPAHREEPKLLKFAAGQTLRTTTGNAQIPSITSDKGYKEL